MTRGANLLRSTRMHMRGIAHNRRESYLVYLHVPLSSMQGSWNLRSQGAQPPETDSMWTVGRLGRFREPTATPRKVGGSPYSCACKGVSVVWKIDGGTPPLLPQ